MANQTSSIMFPHLVPQCTIYIQYTIYLYVSRFKERMLAVICKCLLTFKLFDTLHYPPCMKGAMK